MEEWSALGLERHVGEQDGDGERLDRQRRTRGHVLDLERKLSRVERGADAALGRSGPHGRVGDEPVQVMALGQGDLGAVQVRVDDDERVAAVS